MNSSDLLECVIGALLVVPVILMFIIPKPDWYFIGVTVPLQGILLMIVVLLKALGEKNATKTKQR